MSTQQVGDGGREQTKKDPRARRGCVWGSSHITTKGVVSMILLQKLEVKHYLKISSNSARRVSGSAPMIGDIRKMASVVS